MTVDYIEAVALLLASDQDPAIEETQEILDARALVGSKPHLQAWYEEERVFYAQQEGLLSGFRLSDEAKGRMLKVLQDQADNTAVPSNLITFRRLAFAAAAAVVLLLGFSTFSTFKQSEALTAQTGADTLDGFRGFAVSVVDQGFWLDERSGNHSKLREWLGKEGAPDASHLSSNFDDMATMGCKVLEWNGEKVSLLCYKDGQGQTMHVFVADQLYPVQGTAAWPMPLEVDGRNTISWQDAHSTYVMVGHDRGQALDHISI